MFISSIAPVRVQSNRPLQHLPDILRTGQSVGRSRSSSTARSLYSSIGSSACQTRIPTSTLQVSNTLPSSKLSTTTSTSRRLRLFLCPVEVTSSPTKFPGFLLAEATPAHSRVGPWLRACRFHASCVQDADTSVEWLGNPTYLRRVMPLQPSSKPCRACPSAQNGTAPS